MKRLLLTGFLLLTLLTTAALGWLLGSESGLRWIYRQVEATLEPDTLEVQRLSGSLAGTITLHEVVFANASMNLAIDRAELQWDAWALLSRRLDISRLTLGQLDIRLAPASGGAGGAHAAPTRISLPQLQLPLQVSLGELSIERISLERDETTLILQQLRLRADARDGEIHIDSLALRLADIAVGANQVNDFDIQLAGDIDTVNDYAHRLQVDWQTRLPSGSMVDNSASIKGDLSATRVAQQTRGALQASLVLELDDPLERPGWTADLRIDNFDSGVLDSNLPDLRGAIELSGSGDLTSARITGRVDAESGELGKFDARFDLTSLEPARLADGVNVESLRLAIYDGELMARGQLLWAPRVSWNSTVSATDINPGKLLPDWPGKLNARLQTRGQFENGKLSVSASVEELSGTLRDYPLSLQSELHWRDDSLQVESARLTSGDTRIQATGSVGDALDLDWSLDSNDLAELYPGAQGKLAASGHLGGKLAAPVVAARFNGSALRLQDYAVETVDGDIAVDLLDWKQLDVRINAANLEVQGQQLQALDVHADQGRIGASLSAAEFRARLELAGVLEDRGWHGKLVSAEIDSNDFSSWRLQAPVAVRLAGDSLSIDPFCLDSAQQARACSSLRRGEQSWNISLQLTRIPLRLLQQWTPPDLALDGVVNASADLQYAPADAKLLGSLSAELPAASASYPLQDDRTERFDYRHGELQLSLLAGQVRLTTRLVLQNEDQVEGSLVMPGADLLRLDTRGQAIEARVRVNARDWSIVDAMLPQIEDLHGELMLDIAVGGTLGQPRLQGNARLDDGSFTLREPRLRIEKITLSAQSDGSEQLQFRGGAVAAAGRISLLGETLLNRDTGWPSKLSLQADGFDLATLLAPWIAPPLTVKGLLHGSAELNFRAPDQLFGTARFRAPQGRLSYPLVAQEVERWNYHDAFIDVTLNETGISAQSGITIGKHNSVRAGFALPGARLLALDPQAQALQANANVEFRELNLVQHLLPEIDKMRGQLALDLSVGGSLARPLVSANAKMQQASFTIPRLGLRVTEVTLDGNSDAQNRFFFELSALSGDGKLTIQGSSLLDPVLGWPSHIQVSGENFTVVRIPEALVTASPDLEVSLEGRRIRIEGDLLLPFARLQPKDISNATRVSDDTVIIGRDQPEQEGWLVSTRVNLTLGERVSFFGFGFEGRLGGRLLLEDEPGELSIGTGEIIIREGRYRAYGQRLDISNGRLLFTGSALDNPGLDVRAVRQVNDITVGLQARGRLQQPELELFSNPAMDQTNMLSYLLLGRPMESASGSDGDMMAKAALALGLAGGDNIARRLGDRFGLDEMRVESSDNGDQASLVVGRYLSPKLYVSYGVGLIESINSLNLRYELTERWRLEAESGAYQGADLLFSIER